MDPFAFKLGYQIHL